MKYFARAILISIIKIYQKTISPLFPGSCRFYPSCSEYAIIAITRFGTIRGGILTIRRLLRCQPFGGWGYDPVPVNFSLNPFKKSRRT